MTPSASARAVADRMADAARAWLDSLDDAQRGQAAWPWEVEGERQLWFYTPTDHGGLPLRDMRPAQQSLAMQLVATGLSRAGYVTVSTIMGLENVLDQVEGWQVDWGRERGRDPQLYWLRVFGEPDERGTWTARCRRRRRASSERTRPSRPCSVRTSCARWAGPRTWLATWCGRSTTRRPTVRCSRVSPRSTSSHTSGGDGGLVEPSSSHAVSPAAATTSSSFFVRSL